jgi:hypothetical protein
MLMDERGWGRKRERSDVYIGKYFHSVWYFCDTVHITTTEEEF